MTELITISDFQTFGIVLATNLEANELTRYIIEAQEFDVKPQLGELIYYDLLDNSADPNYVALLDGNQDYVLSGYNYKYNLGLKAALCYYTLARYLLNASAKNTEMGFMRKKNEFSEHMDTKAIMVMVNDAKSSAYGYMQNVVTYLNHSNQLVSNTYPLWGAGLVESCGVYPTKSTITKVGNV